VSDLEFLSRICLPLSLVFVLYLYKLHNRRSLEALRSKLSEIEGRLSRIIYLVNAEERGGEDDGRADY
jgi:hypothetical protein